VFDLVDQIRRFSADCDPRFAAEVERLANVDAYSRAEPSGGYPPVPILRTIAGLHSRLPSARALLDAIRSKVEDLRWYPAPSTVPSHVLNRLAAAELIGPDGECYSDRDRLGVFVMEAETDFPSHRHCASEFYAVVAGTATWDLDHQQVALEPGGVIEVPSRAWHAIRTGPEPMLCCYLWHGTVGFDDYEFRPTTPAR
jgi:mannose-6-phosphate isomerase-like protein (cupin superfamily)